MKINVIKDTHCFFFSFSNDHHVDFHIVELNHGLMPL